MQFQLSGFSGLCPCCPVKPRPIGAGTLPGGLPLNLPGLFSTPSLTSAGLFGIGSGLERNAFGHTGASSSAFPSMSEPRTSSSVEELRRKAQEHSAALIQSLQQHAMEFHLQQQHQQQQQRKKESENVAEHSSD